ncbi:hypothetical protein D3P44_016555 [Stutzerimonas balearica]|uniref:hypothetical protein n=1 Tax=Stutzerimonas balearica TaxID=74829 RepID=UPI001BAF9717|nr:hypothetical protein [Stutzerimonas balearica]WAN08990.1 hypothetical protein D3P44_016555 [Stutzerimonas balearica]
MKKFALGLAAFLVTANSYAATLIDVDENNRLLVKADSDCTLLSENVNLSLSKDVVAAYNCNTGTNIIAISGCHPNGLRSGTGNTQSNYYTASTAGGVIKADQGTACTEEGTVAMSKADAESGVVPDTGTPPTP